jgi:hypothetical protein
MMNVAERKVGTGAATLALGCLILATGCGSGAVGEAGPVTTVVAAGATHPTVAVSPRSGRSFVVWVGNDGGQYNVYLAAAEAGSTDFSEPVRVNDVPGDAAPHEQAPATVALGPADEVYVVWQNNTEIEGRRFPASDLRFAVSLDGGASFLPTITVNDDAGEIPSSHTFQAMTVGGDGSVFVSWIDSREQDRERASHGAHAAHGSGGMMGMGEGSETGPEIRVARSTDRGRSFEPSVVVDGNSCPCCRTAIATGPDGTLYVGWRKVFDGDVRDIVVARADPGGPLAFDEPVRVHDDGWVFPGCPHAGPSLQVDDEGRLHVGWYTGVDDRQGLWYTSSADGARTFGRALPVLAGEWVPPSQVVLARAADGVWIVWEDRTDHPATVGFARSVGGAAPTRVTQPVAAARSPAIASDGERALVAWADGESLQARWLSEKR